MQNRAIVAVGKHVIAKIPNTSGCIAIRVDEPADFGVIVAALEIVEASFGIVVISSVSQRVYFSHAAGCGEDFAIGVIIVSSDFVAGRID